MSQASGFGQVFVVQLERRRDRRVQHFEFVRQHFDLAGFQVAVAGAVRAQAHHAGDTQAEFVAHCFRVLEYFGAVRIAHHLHQAFAVAQVDENDAAMIATTMHPAAQADGLAEKYLSGEAAVLGSHGHIQFFAVQML